MNKINVCLCAILMTIFFVVAEACASDEAGKQYRLQSFGWKKAGGSKMIMTIQGQDRRDEMPLEKPEHLCVSESIHYELRRLNTENRGMCDQFKSRLNRQCLNADAAHINECMSSEMEWSNATIEDVSMSTGIKEGIIKNDWNAQMWRKGISRDSQTRYVVFLNQIVSQNNRGVNVMQSNSYIVRNGKTNGSLGYGIGAPFMYGQNLYSISIYNGEVAIDEIAQVKIGKAEVDTATTVCAYTINAQSCNYEVKK